MSRELKDGAFDALPYLPATVSTGDRAVWLWIANRESDQVGYAWCSNADIAAATGLTIGWVPHAVAALESAGLLTVQRRRGSNNRYQIVIPNHRGERGTGPDGTTAVSAVPSAVSAVDHRGERGRNQLDNQLDNRAAPRRDFTSAQCDHRWRSVSGECPTCLADEQREAM